jgi:hypothetical protein
MKTVLCAVLALTLVGCSGSGSLFSGSPARIELGDDFDGSVFLEHYQPRKQCCDPCCAPDCEIEPPLPSPDDPNYLPALEALLEYRKAKRGIRNRTAFAISRGGADPTPVTIDGEIDVNVFPPPTEESEPENGANEEGGE